MIEPQRVLPKDIDAEKSLLGSMLLNSLVCDEVADLVAPEDFFDRDHGELFRHMMAMNALDRRIDVVLLGAYLRKQKLPVGFAEEYGGIAGMLAKFSDAVPHAGNAVHYARLVREAAALREVIAASEETLNQAYAPKCDPAEVLGAAESRLFGVLERRTVGKIVPIQDVLVQAMAELDARSRNQTAGIPTGLTKLDQQLGGLRAGQLVILAGRTSMGKTAMACNIAEHVACDQQICTLLVSLEMSSLELADRMLSAKGRVSAHRMRAGFMGEPERKKLINAQVELSQSALQIDESYSASVGQIAAQARRLKRRKELGLLIVDYLQIVTPDNPRDSRQEQVSGIARRLKALARELNVPVLALAQLNRQADTGDAKPRLSHLRESGSLEQEADVVLFCHRPEYYATSEEARRELAGQAVVIVAKQRNGPTGEVKVVWLGEYMRFENLAEDRTNEGTEFNPDEWVGGQRSF